MTKYYTLDEYKTLIEANQTDKEGNIIYLYATDKTAQYNYITAATDKGYDVLQWTDSSTATSSDCLSRSLRSRTSFVSTLM